MQQCLYISRLLATLLVIIGMVCCSGEDCSINNTVMGKMAFYDPYGDAVTFVGTLSVSVVRPQGDSVVINRKGSASDVLFPLSYTHEVDTVVFDYNNGAAYDTLYISHTNMPTLVSVDCGVAMFHSITAISATHHVIDSLILKSSEVNYDERENIQVIYRTDD